MALVMNRSIITKPLLCKDKFKNIEQSLKAGHTSLVQLKIYQKSTIRLYVKSTL